MNTFFIVIYLVSFCLIAGGAFAMMYANIQSIWNTPPAPPRPRHPEAPEPGEEVMYVDLNRDRLEELYKEVE
tara:strand:- start:435 stop:650 length:216 start_codon:yes stop_codon:yes gene_type:complete